MVAETGYRFRKGSDEDDAEGGAGVNWNGGVEWREEEESVAHQKITAMRVSKGQKVTQVHHCLHWGCVAAREVSYPKLTNPPKAIMRDRWLLHSFSSAIDSFISHTSK
jgi:hypothetical protein